VKANQDIRDYMADHGVSQRDLAAAVGVSQYSINKMLQTEMSQKDKEMHLNLIDAIVADRATSQDEGETQVDDAPVEESAPAETEDVSCSTKFQIGDRVKIPSKANKIAIVNDIWTSLAKSVLMYAVENEDDGYCGMYAEDQLEPAPLPIDYSFDAHIDGNVAVVAMTAKQGNRTWIYARGHAHILHDGEVGLAQAVSYAARRMFETLDKKQEKQIYFKGVQE
jgi:DNA-binding Xre family transcriptional regulator